jgi:hypothetical protein
MTFVVVHQEALAHAARRRQLTVHRPSGDAGRSGGGYAAGKRRIFANICTADRTNEIAGLSRVSVWAEPGRLCINRWRLWKGDVGLPTFRMYRDLREIPSAIGAGNLPEAKKLSQWALALAIWTEPYH